MNQILLRVLAVVLSGVSPEKMETRSVSFNRLPVECVTVYRTFRRTDIAEIIVTDLDGDRFPELLIFNGEHGSGGAGWTVMQKINGRYRNAGEVFGVLYKSGSGLIVESPCGWSYADWSYYELVNGKLVKKISIGVEYDKPIRQNPISINIRVEK